MEAQRSSLRSTQLSATSTCVLREDTGLEEYKVARPDKHAIIRLPQTRIRCCEVRFSVSHLGALGPSSSKYTRYVIFQWRQQWLNPKSPTATCFVSLYLPSHPYDPKTRFPVAELGSRYCERVRCLPASLLLVVSKSLGVRPP